MALTGGMLKETRPASERAHSSLGSALRGYGVLLRDGEVWLVAQPALLRDLARGEER